MLDLLAELTETYARVTERHEDYLAAAGIVRFASVTCEVRARIVTYQTRALCGAHPIVTSDDARAPETGCIGSFEPAPEGRNAVIVPVGIAGPDGLWDDVFDLVAFYLDAPHRWWLRTGETLLGEQHVADSIDCGTGVRLVATPMDWLRAGGAAACILDWRQADPRLLFQGVDAIECDTPELAKRLKKRVADLSRPDFNITAEAAVPVAQRAPAAAQAPRARPPAVRVPAERRPRHLQPVP